MRTQNVWNQNGGPKILKGISLYKILGPPFWFEVLVHFSVHVLGPRVGPMVRILVQDRLRCVDPAPGNCQGSRNANANMPWMWILPSLSSLHPVGRRAILQQSNHGHLLCRRYWVQIPLDILRACMS